MAFNDEKIGRKCFIKNDLKIFQLVSTHNKSHETDTIQEDMYLFSRGQI